MNDYEKFIINGQSASKPLSDLSYEESSEIIPVKGSRLELFLSETPNIIIENLFSKGKFNKTSCIYCIFSKHNYIPYIGSTINLQKRAQSHREKLRSNTHYAKWLQRIFNKYTFRNIFIFILEEVTKENIEEKELYWINYFDSVNNGFNATYETQRNFINEDIKKIIKQKNSKPVLMFTLDGNLVKEFESVKDASIFVKDQSTNISACCKGRLTYVKNYTFRYKKDFTDFKLRQSKTGVLTESCRLKIMAKVCKKIICNNIIYDSISDAERLNNISRGSLGRYIKDNKPYKNMLFQYYEDMIQPLMKVEE